MAIIGIISGLVGSAITGVTSIMKLRIEAQREKNKFAHDEKMWEHESAMLKLQSQAKVSEMEIESFMTQIRGSFKGLEASINDQSVATGRAHRIAASILSLFRPFITTALVAFMFYIAAESVGLIDRLEQADFALVAIIDLASMAVTWWFGDRSQKRANQNIVNGGRVRAAGGAF